jgi:HlyD family secretion protein
MIRDTSQQDEVIEPGNRRRRRAIWLTAIVCLSIAALVLLIPNWQRWASADISVPRERLRIATLAHRDFVRDVNAPGRVVAAVAPTLYAPAMGTVTLEVQAGDEVAEGQVLARIESPEILNQLAREQSTLESLTLAWELQKIETRTQALGNQQTVDLAQVNLNAARREAARAEQSQQRGILSERELERAQDELALAEVSFKHATESAELANERLEFELRSSRLAVDQQQLTVDDIQRRANALLVRAPVTGLIGNVAIEQKAAVDRNTPLLTVVDLRAMEIEAQIPESYADSLGLGMPAVISYGNNTYQGVVAAVSPEVQAAQVTTRIRFADVAPGDLRQNQRVSTRIVMETKDNVLTVQRGPFLESGAGRVAYRVEQGVAHRVPMQIGSISVDQVEIIDGLNAGDEIIISNTDAFEDAATVYLTE